MFSDDTSHTESLCTPLRVFRGRAYKKSGKPSSLAGLHTARGQKPPRRAKCLWRRIAHAFISIKVARFEIGHTPRKFPASRAATSRINAYLCSHAWVIITQQNGLCKPFFTISPKFLTFFRIWRNSPFSTNQCIHFWRIHTFVGGKNFPTAGRAPKAPAYKILWKRAFPPSMREGKMA